LDDLTTGAWLTHHGKKVHKSEGGAAAYPTIDVAAKTTSLLHRMAETQDSSISKSEVETLAAIGNMNPMWELQNSLNVLRERRLIDVADNGAVSVLGLNGRSALKHGAQIFKGLEPRPYETAAIILAEKASDAPISREDAQEYIADECKLSKSDTTDFFEQAEQIGFVDYEGKGSDKLLFNGNLFRRETLAKTNAVLTTLKPNDERLVLEFSEKLKLIGAIDTTEAANILGKGLFDKLRAAAVFDENIVSNETGDHGFMTSPASFHKFENPMVDDAFDHAKALVSALKYGMSKSTAERGRLSMVQALLRKLINGHSVGPAPAIGYDYRVLERERVVQITAVNNTRFTMRLLKKDVGELAYQVLSGGNGGDPAIVLPGASMKGYTAPEAARTRFRQKEQLVPSKKSTRDMLSVLRRGRS